MSSNSKSDESDTHSACSHPRPHFSIINVPWERRIQTFAVTCFVAALPISSLCLCSSIALLFYTPFNILMLTYLVYIFFIDDSATTGKKTSQWLRSLSLFVHFKNYFPVTLVKTAELPPEGKYILAYHPHGIIGLGAIVSFATDGCGFSKLFPGIRINPMTLASNLQLPFIREVWLSLGFCLADRRTFRNVLARPGGAVALVVGGAAESLKTAPGTLRLELARRKGFVRQALLSDAALVPVLGFGETDAYDVYHWGVLAGVQRRMQKAMGFAIPLFHGRGVFNYDFGLLPHRRPITVVVGRPLPPPAALGGGAGGGGNGNGGGVAGHRAAERGEGWLLHDPEGVRLVDEYHAAYVQALRALYDAHKEVYFTHRRESLRIE